MWEVIGWIAAIAGIIYPIPQVIKVVKAKSADGVSRYFLALWLIDKAMTLVVMIHMNQVPMIVKYAFGTSCILIIIFVKFSVDNINE